KKTAPRIGPTTSKPRSGQPRAARLGFVHMSAVQLLLLPWLMRAGELLGLVYTHRPSLVLAHHDLG
ncbi:MAG: hypothetical protein WCO91_00250, partial [Gemmataceae bacterium]